MSFLWWYCDLMMYSTYSCLVCLVYELLPGRIMESRVSATACATMLPSWSWRAASSSWLHATAECKNLQSKTPLASLMFTTDHSLAFFCWSSPCSRLFSSRLPSCCWSASLMCLHASDMAVETSTRERSQRMTFRTSMYLPATLPDAKPMSGHFVQFQLTKQVPPSVCNRFGKLLLQRCNFLGSALRFFLQVLKVSEIEGSSVRRGMWPDRQPMESWILLDDSEESYGVFPLWSPKWLINLLLYRMDPKRVETKHVLNLENVCKLSETSSQNITVRSQNHKRKTAKCAVPVKPPRA